MNEYEEQGAGTRVSSDGHWWWTGRRWVAATTADGLWRWDGSKWQFTLEAARHDPAALGAGLQRLAVEREAEAGAILTRRRSEWPVPPALQGRIEEAAVKLVRLDELQAFLDQRSGQPEGGLAGILSRLGGSDDPAAVEREEQRVVAELEPVLAEVGRSAPRPSLKEADELIEQASILTLIATEITAAVAALVEAERAEGERLAAAEEALAAAEDEVASLLRPALEEVESARADRDRRLIGLRREVAALRSPGPGLVVAEFGGFSCHELAVEAPGGGRGPLAGARAEVGQAAALSRQWPEIVDDLLLTEAPGSRQFQEAEVGEGGDAFLLVITPLGSWLKPCGPDDLQAATDFAARVNAAAATAVTQAAVRQEAVRAARARLDAAAADRAELEAAEQRLAARSVDPALRGSVEAARDRLQRERSAPGEAAAARARLDAVLERLIGQPEPLLPES